MKGTVNSMRRCVTWTSTSLSGAIFVNAWLWGCGGPSEEVKSPAAGDVAQVAWGAGTEAPEPPEEPEPAAPASEGTRAGPVEIDLDAPSTGEPAPENATAPASDTEAEASESEAAAEPESEPPAAPAEPSAPMPLGKEIRAAVKSKEPPLPSEKPSSKKPKPSPKQAAAAAEPAAPAYKGPSPCKAESFGVPRVQEACAKGGRTAAKGVMKEAIGKALAAGASLKCGDCHTEQKDYTLKKDAVAQLTKWLGP